MSNERENRVIHTFPYRQGEEIQMALTTFQGRHFVDLRLWYQGKGDGQNFKPTRKGIYFGVDKFPEFQKGMLRMTKAVDAMRQRSDEHEMDMR